jgi:hypothetical protein
MFPVTALLAATLGVAGAQPPVPFATPAAVAPAPPGVAPAPIAADASFSFVTVRISDGKLLMPQRAAVPVAVEKVITVTTPEGRTEARKVVVTEFQTVEKLVAQELSDVTVIGVDGKPIPADRLERALLKDTPVVLSRGGEVPEKYRGLFKDGTLFVRLRMKPVPVPGPGARPVPLPAPIPAVPAPPPPPRPPTPKIP